jgi:peroxiredoxin Q/BCP
MNMAKLKSGEKAPNFNLKDQNEKTVKLSDFKGRKLLLFFYPKASTSGCTQQARNVRDAAPELAKLNAAAVGVSPDEPKDQKKFDDKNTLGFPLLSDSNHKVADAYGVWGEKSMYGKKYLGIMRSAFLIDEKGKIVRALYKVSPKDTVPKILEAISEPSGG